MNRLYKLKEVSGLLQLRYNKILELIKFGDLKAVRIGKSFRVTQHDLHAFIENNRYRCD